MDIKEFSKQCDEIIGRSDDPETCHANLDDLLLEAVEKHIPGASVEVRKVKKSCAWWACS